MKAKSVFICNQCGNETPRWQGQCPACGAWNSIVEFEDKKPAANKASSGTKLAASKPKKLRELDASDRQIRFSTGLGELDRVLGGGGVKGSLVLVGGAPGIGKSTLLLQICAYLGKIAENFVCFRRGIRAAAQNARRPAAGGERQSICSVGN